MSDGFYTFMKDLDEMINKEFISQVPEIKILLHKYFYGQPQTLLTIINYLRDECELSDINYNHNARTFTIKFNKNTIKKLKKKYDIEDLDVNNLYRVIEQPFHNFLCDIQVDFSTMTFTAPELTDNEERQKVRYAFLYFAANPCTIKYLVQIVSMLERDNHIIINV